MESAAIWSPRVPYFWWRASSLGKDFFAGAFHVAQKTTSPTLPGVSVTLPVPVDESTANGGAR